MTVSCIGVLSDWNSARTGYLYVNGFLAGIVFTTMVLLIQIQDKISFSEFLIPATAGVAIMFIMGTLSVLFYLAPDAESPKHATKALGGFFLIGLFGLLVIIPLLIAQFTFFGAIGVAIVVVISIAVWIKHGFPLNYKI